VSVDYIAIALITSQSGSISITGQGVSFTGNATLTQASVGGAVGDLIKGSATWRVA
jgi:L-lactate permease